MNCMVYRRGQCVQPLRASGPLESSSSAKVQMRFSEYPLAFLRGNELTAGGRAVCLLSPAVCGLYGHSRVTRYRSSLGQTICESSAAGLHIQ